MNGYNELPGQIMIIQVRNDKLTSTNFCLVLKSCRRWFWSVTIPMYGLEVNQFCLGPLFRFGLGKNFLEKAKLFNVDL